MSSKKAELCERIVLILLADAAVQYIEGESLPPDIPVIRSLIDEWGKDGIQTRCKRQLGVLLSFLGGEGETKMHALLAGAGWPFKEYKIEETVEVLQTHMRYFESSFETRLGFSLVNTIVICDSVDDAFKVCSSWLCKVRYTLFFSIQFKHPKFHILHAVRDVLEGYGRVNEAIACFLKMKDEQAEDIQKVCMVNIKTYTMLNLNQNPGTQTAITHDNDQIKMLERNTYPGSYPVDIGGVQSLPRSSEAVPVINVDMFTRHELNEENDPFPFHDSLSTPLNLLFGGPSENGSPSDLTGQVRRPSNHPFALGGFGDIYQGNLNMRGRLINVRHHSFSSVKLNNHQVAIKAAKMYLQCDHHLLKKMKVRPMCETNERN